MNIVEPIVGGLLIGASAALLLWTLGRVAGISGIVWQSLQSRALGMADGGWRLSFLLGLVLGPLLLMLFSDFEPPKPSEAGWPVLLVAGLLVGFGTRLGAGCTSGHGICGIARFSGRSIVATLVFMATGVMTVAVVKHVIA